MLVVFGTVADTVNLKTTSRLNSLLLPPLICIHTGEVTRKLFLDSFVPDLGIQILNWQTTRAILIFLRPCCKGTLTTVK